MTGQDRDLVEELLCGAHPSNVTVTDRAAARIQTLSAEVERLINAGDGDVGLIHWQGERIEALKAEVERLRDTPNRIWAEARDSEWDEGFNYAVKLFRAALGEEQ